MYVQVTPQTHTHEVATTSLVLPRLLTKLGLQSCSSNIAYNEARGGGRGGGGYSPGCYCLAYSGAITGHHAYPRCCWALSVPAYCFSTGRRTIYTLQCVIMTFSLQVWPVIFTQMEAVWSPDACIHNTGDILEAAQVHTDSKKTYSLLTDPWY